MAWQQQNWSQPLNNFPVPGIPQQSQMGGYNPMQFNPTMTPEQHYAMQQNWQQWQTYQQQYAQWQATYGEKYQHEMQQKFNQNTSIMPPIIPQVGGVSAMPGISHLPPPPPNQPAPLPPPPPENEAFQKSSNATDPLNQRPFQAASTVSGSISRTANYPNPPAMGPQQFNNNRGIGGGIGANANSFSGHVARNQFESVAVSNPPPPVANEFVAKTSNQLTEDVTDKTPEEKAFDEQFKKWEEEFTRWKLQNANHPDTRAYMEYEQKMEECRTKLLERREQMKRRKLELLQQKQQQQLQQPPPVTTIPQEPARMSNEPRVSGYSHSSGSMTPNDSMDKLSSGGDVPPPSMENSSNSKSQLFSRDSVSGSGIPGLDLVVDKANDGGNNDIDERDNVVINDTSPKRDDKASHQNASNIQQRPDLEAISRGITSILGDPNLASLLSNFQPKSIPSAATKSVIPSLLDMKMPDIDPNSVPQFNWQDDDDDDEDDEDNGPDNSVPIHQRHENALSPNVQSNENTQQNSNQLNHCDDDDAYDDDFDAEKEHERFAEMSYDDMDERPFQMNRMDNSNSAMHSRDNFSRNAMPNPVNQFGSSNFTQDNEPSGNFNSNRSNFMNDSGEMDNFNRNRGMNFGNDNFNENRANFNQRQNFNENMRGNAGNFNQQNSVNFQGNRMNNPFDKPAFGNSSNFNNERNDMGNNFQFNPSNSNFSGNNNFGNNLNQSMGNGQFNNENNEFHRRNDDRNNGDFSRRRNVVDGPSNFDSSNSQFSSNNNYGQSNSQAFNVQNRGPLADSFASDNAKDEDFFRPIKVIDYSANSKKPAPANDDIIKPMKVVDYGHQTTGIVSRPANASRRPVNKYTGGDFFPVKTIDYNHSSNKHMIKEYYYSIVSKWDPSSISSKSSPMHTNQQTVNRGMADGSGSGNNNEAMKPRNPAPYNPRTRELKEITYEQLSSINVATKQGKRMKRALIMKRSTVNDYPIGHKFYPAINWLLLNEESRKRPGLPTKRGKRKRKNGTTIPFNKTIPVPDSLNDFEEILSNDDDSLEDYDMTSDLSRIRKTDGEQMKPSAMKPATVRPVRQNVVLLEDIIYNPGRQGRPHKIVIIMRGPPGSGKTFLAKLIKDKEAENDGVAVRILSIDDYFKTEVDETRKCPETGKTLNVKKMVYEYEREMEDTYMQYLMKSYKKTVVDGLFDFIIVDSIASTLRHYTEFYNFAKVYAFTPYTCEMERDPDICFKRNIHGRTLDEIKAYCDHWTKTPEQYLKLDFDSFIRDAGPFDVVGDE